MPHTLPNYDATFCGKLPLHQTNLIQPHGYLFVLDPASFQVLQVSDNIVPLLGKTPSATVGTSFSTYIDGPSFLLLQKMVGQHGGNRQPVSLQINANGQPVSCSAQVQVTEDQVLLEVLNPEKVAGQGRSFLEVFQEVKTLMHQMETCTDITGFAEVVARELRRISGFDKVMVYSFDSDWNGTVIGEDKEPEIVSYLQLRFPASDIPKPARELYLKNPYRFIPDSDYQPARLYPLLNPKTHALSDLSACDLRSVAAVHLEYLRNMEVGASLSFRLVHNGQLWGLVSCHHRTPKYFSFENMGVFELLSGIISSQLSIVLNNAGAGQKQKLQEGLTSLVPLLHKGDSLQKAVADNVAQVQQLLGAGGLAYNLNGHIHTTGAVPETIDLDHLFFWLKVQSPTTVLHYASLPEVYEEGAAFASVGSGMLALPVVPDAGHFVVAFRPEAAEEVSWGGNPHEALQFEPDGKTYHPRNSFQVWKQKVKNKAKPWSAEELVYAEAFRNVLTDIALRGLHA